MWGLAFTLAAMLRGRSARPDAQGMKSGILPLPEAHGCLLFGEENGLSRRAFPVSCAAMMQTRTSLLQRVFRYWQTYGMRATVARVLRGAPSCPAPVREVPSGALVRPAWETVRERLASPQVELVVFDIFDTLVTRPLLDPEHTKLWVARQLGCPDYPARRQAAEQAARDALRREVDLGDICAEYVRRFGSGEGSAQVLQAAEERVELLLVRPLAGMQAALAAARAVGKRIVLASDMFLPEAVVREILARCGVTDFDALYLSSSLGMRKSEGSLYQRICAEEGLAPGQVLMVGDNPHADQAVPAAQGIAVAPAISPVQQLAQLPRLKAWAERVRTAGGLAEELVLGSIVHRCLDARPGREGVARDLAYDPGALAQGGRYGIGYAILGPVLAAFSQWLARRAREEGVARLYFLAREGQVMQAAYDILMAGRPGPESRYLVLSRRAISVPMIQSREDILAIASADYHPNALASFLFRRFGLALDDAALADLCRRGLWSPGQLVTVSGGQPDGQLQALLDELTPRILAAAAAERGPMLAYLEQEGLTAAAGAGGLALVDVGYTGTIQGRLCELTGREVHGYYMITRAAVARVRQRHGVRTAGCFGDDLEAPEQSPLLRYNMPLEMLMGSDDPQVACYRQAGDGSVAPVFNGLSADEQASSALRQELRAGALDFVRDWRALEDAGLDVPPIPLELPARLFQDFWEGLAASERALIGPIASDDHYCGMGIVHFSTFMPPLR